MSEPESAWSAPAAWHGSMSTLGKSKGTGGDYFRWGEQDVKKSVMRENTICLKKRPGLIQR